MSRHLISQTFLDRLEVHHERREAIEKRGNSTNLPKNTDPDTGTVYFDYEDRYKLKDKEQSKLDFTNSAKISKQYANALIKRCNLILVRPELFFVWDHRGDNRTLGEQLFEKKKKKAEQEDWSEEKEKVQKNKRNSISLKKKKMKKQKRINEESNIVVDQENKNKKEQDVEEISKGMVKLEIEYQQTASLKKKQVPPKFTQEIKYQEKSSQHQSYENKDNAILDLQLTLIDKVPIGSQEEQKSEHSTLFKSNKQQNSNSSSKHNKSKICSNPFFVDIRSSFRFSSGQKPSANKQHIQSEEKESKQGYERILTNSLLNDSTA